MKRYPDHLLGLLTDEGFDAAFEKNINGYPTHAAAYEAVEDELLKYFNWRKYANYDSYRVCRNLRIKKKSDPDQNLKKRL